MSGSGSTAVVVVFTVEDGNGKFSAIDESAFSIGCAGSASALCTALVGGSPPLPPHAHTSNINTEMRIAGVCCVCLILITLVNRTLVTRAGLWSSAGARRSCSTAVLWLDGFGWCRYRVLGLGSGGRGRCNVFSLGLSGFCNSGRWGVIIGWLGGFGWCRYRIFGLGLSGGGRCCLFCGGLGCCSGCSVVGGGW